MGGDVMFTQPLIRASKSCGTLTLGGVETEDGTRGFIVSGHVTAISVEVEDGVWRQDYSLTDNLIGHNRDSWGNVQHLLGKVHTMPSFFQEGDKRILSADAAFVAYPRPTTPGCSLTWSGNHEEFCLDSNDSEQIERLAPLQVRGEGDTVHTVIGSRAVTEGLPIRISGTVTGEPVSSIASGNKLLLWAAMIFTNYTIIIPTTLMAVKVSEETAALRSTPPLTQTATSPWWVFSPGSFRVAESVLSTHGSR